jgi:hypothetical protein
MSKSTIKTQAFAMTSTPDIIVFSRRILWRAGERTKKPVRATPWGKTWAPAMSELPLSFSGIIVVSIRFHSSRLSREVSRSPLDSSRKNRMMGLDFIARAWMLMPLLVGRRFFIDNSIFWAHARAGARVGANGFIWGPYEVHMGSYGTILEVSKCFLMGYMNFEVPECVDSDKYENIVKV